MKKPTRGFTLIEMLAVITIIAILTGLVLSLTGLVRNKQARAVAQGQIAAFSAACEVYKGENGLYPSEANTTDKLNPASSFNPSAYVASSLEFYRLLSGDMDVNGSMGDNGGTVYYNFDPKILKGTKDASTGRFTAVTGLEDPWGNAYGYSTLAARNAEAGTTSKSQGFNPTFDLWTTAGGTSSGDVGKWIKNW